MINDDLYWVWFTNLKGIGPSTQEELLKVFKNPRAIWDATKNDLIESKVLNATKILSIIDKKNKNESYITLETIDKLKIDVISINDSRYPELLKNIYNYPRVIYVQGKLQNDKFHFAIVGTRTCTNYGRDVTERISEELARSGMTIVSGMAEGIDTYAHKGAISGGGTTIAVLGSGHNKIYPQSNIKLYHSIIENGAVISQYLPEFCATKYSFPERNRIISGLSQGVLVVESKAKGGALITSDFAHEQNRDVFVIPGNITCRTSEGTNNLLKEGAFPVTCSDDIIDIYKNKGVKDFIDFEKRKKIFENRIYLNSSEIQKDIINLLFIKEMDMDELADITKFNISKLSFELTILEVNGLIRVLPGGIYCINS